MEYWSDDNYGFKFSSSSSSKNGSRGDVAQYTVEDEYEDEEDWRDKYTSDNTKHRKNP